MISLVKLSGGPLDGERASAPSGEDIEYEYKLEGQVVIDGFLIDQYCVHRYTRKEEHLAIYSGYRIHRKKSKVSVT